MASFHGHLETPLCPEDKKWAVSPSHGWGRKPWCPVKHLFLKKTTGKMGTGYLVSRPGLCFHCHQATARYVHLVLPWYSFLLLNTSLSGKWIWKRCHGKYSTCLRKTTTVILSGESHIFWEICGQLWKVKQSVHSLTCNISILMKWDEKLLNTA